jgi:hypothetical protein
MRFRVDTVIKSSTTVIGKGSKLNKEINYLTVIGALKMKRETQKISKTERTHRLPIIIFYQHTREGLLYNCRCTATTAAVVSVTF